MNFTNILNEIEQADPEVYDKLSGRRQVLKSFGSKVAVAALPFAIGSLFKKAYGKTSDVVADIFNLALQFEYLEYNYYHTGNNTGALIPANYLPGFQSLEAQEKMHINFLKTTITAMGAVPYTPNHYSATATNALFVPDGYDFTAGGVYSPFDSLAVFLDLAQIFEDTGVHAIKGQIQSIVGNGTVLTQAMQLQCAEARHAAHVRFVRRYTGALENPAPWITNNIPPTIPLQAYYDGEDNLVQNGVTINNLTDIYDKSGYVPKVSATAAFDEGYDKITVQAFIAPFLK